MLSMVSANRFVYIGAIPLVAVAYAIFVWMDHNHNVRDSTIIKHDIQDIQNSGSSVEGLMFGGSNAHYSLSAESLSYYTGGRWYNASIESEMYSVSRYKKFIQDLSASMDRTKVKYVVYSSFVPYTIG